MATTAYRYLTKTPGVRGGNTVVERTRIGVHDVVGLVVNGAGVDDVVRSLPDLKEVEMESAGCEPFEPRLLPVRLTPPPVTKSAGQLREFLDYLSATLREKFSRPAQCVEAMPLAEAFSLARATSAEGARLWLN